MNKSNVLAILALITGLVLMFLFTKNCTGVDDSTTISTGDKTVEVKFVTKLDTVYVRKYVHVVDTIRVPTLVKADTVYVEGSKDVATIPKIKRVYEDVVRPVDSVSVAYKAEVTGTLDNIAIDYKDRRAEKTIVRTNTVETTITNTVQPGGVFVGISANVGLDELAPSIQYVKGKNMYGVKYNVAGATQGIQNIGVTYSRRIL